ncbi:MAG: rhodanese-like domain-containing protein [Flavobacteriales bacterium]|nr:rhodanese-like domain-containing protein [Flavobacteriales bacterium]
MKKTFLISFVTILYLASCNSSKHSDTIETKATENGFLLLSTNEFEVKLNSESNSQLIDVRTASEFDLGSIENAKNFDILDGTFQNQLSTLDKSKTVFVFCAKGGRSNKASNLLQQAGFNSVIDLKGGYTAWSKVHP